MSQVVHHISQFAQSLSRNLNDNESLVLNAATLPSSILRSWEITSAILRSVSVWLARLMATIAASSQDFSLVPITSRIASIALLPLGIQDHSLLLIYSPIRSTPQSLRGMCVVSPQQTCGLSSIQAGMNDG